MNKAICALFIVAISFCLVSGCAETPSTVQGSGVVKSEVRNVSTFNAVDLRGKGDLYVTQGGPQTVRIEADDNLLPQFSTTVQNDVLIIDTHNLQLNNITPVRIFIKTPAIRRLTLSGSGSLNSDGAIMGEALETGISGAGTMNLRLEEISLTTRISGDGTANLAGNVSNHVLTISGTGLINALGLTTKTTSIEITGNGKAHVHAAETLNLKISGTGTITYTGNPLTVNKEISGIAQISPV
jgi:hypothetical protein